MKEKISAVYKIVNEVTGDFYVGSSKDIYRRWKEHKKPSTWKDQPNSSLYKDMQKYGVPKFRFQILCPVMPEYLTQVEQELIEMLKPTYNSNNAKGIDVERQKKYRKYYQQTEKGKEVHKKYLQSEKGKETQRKYNDEYFHQLCNYNGETLTLNALRSRFQRAGIPHATIEAKKYLIKEED